jgi:hypothetical protein
MENMNNLFHHSLADKTVGHIDPEQLVTLTQMRRDENVDIASLVASIAQQGLRDPIIVNLLTGEDQIAHYESAIHRAFRKSRGDDALIRIRREGRGKNAQATIVIAGHRRLRAIRQLQRTDPEAYQCFFAEGVQAIIYQGLSPAIALGLQTEENNTKAAVPTKDRLDSLEALVFALQRHSEETGGSRVTRIQIATAFGVSAGTVGKLLSFIEYALRPVYQAVEQGTISLEIGLHLINFSKRLAEHLAASDTVNPYDLIETEQISRIVTEKLVEIIESADSAKNAQERLERSYNDIVSGQMDLFDAFENSEANRQAFERQGRILRRANMIHQMLSPAIGWFIRIRTLASGKLSGITMNQEESGWRTAQAITALGKCLDLLELAVQDLADAHLQFKGNAIGDQYPEWSSIAERAATVIETGNRAVRDAQCDTAFSTNLG